ncbi:MAG: deoxyribose-phosphate aldolase [Bacteroidales bacterium]|jgi:deoxyribose-phosphate aldolase|nr:deoxyribose-phosphate aldolase [Bacteroidales bacterium]
MAYVEPKSYPYTDEQIKQRIAEYQADGLKTLTAPQAYRLLLGAIDLTTLEGSDNAEKVRQLCEKAMAFRDDQLQIPSTAAVCVYPPFAAQCKEMLKGTSIHVACVAGAFPAGQSPIEVKLAEVRYAVAQGADEIDMVISRGKFLEGDYRTVYDEIAAIKEACGKAHLKVILETGELGSADNIYKASQLAIAAGADFIKTSTGKIKVNATPESFLVMLDALKAHFDATGKRVGIKPAGGISDAPTAMLFLTILEHVLGEKWFDTSHFRIGASRLADKIRAEI